MIHHICRLLDCRRALLRRRGSKCAIELIKTIEAKIEQLARNNFESKHKNEPKTLSDEL